MRLSDAAQLQKWQYLQSTSHLGNASSDAATELIDRAINADVTDPSYYCSSLIEWGRRMRLDIRRAVATPMPPPLTALICKAATATTRPVYTDGSFLINAPLLAYLTLPPSMLTRGYSVAATGVHLPRHEESPPLALLVRTPAECATDAYYQELLGTAISIQLAKAAPITAYSDCSSAITRTQQAQNILGPAIGHLQHGSLLLGIRHTATTLWKPLSLTWTASHPKRTKSQSEWTSQDWGIHLADTIAGAVDIGVGACDINVCDSEDIFAAWNMAVDGGC